MISMNRKRIVSNNDKYEEKENVIKQWLVWKEREFYKIMINMKRNRIISNNDKYEEKDNFIK